MSPKRVDPNQKIITDMLRARGCSVQPLHEIGQGAPDLLVGYFGRNYLFEIKDKTTARGRAGLNDKQKEWHRKWEGQVNVVHNFEEIWVILK